jgi:hypothetical protein
MSQRAIITFLNPDHYLQIQHHLDLSLAMGWRYRAGLLLIFIVVITWVTSAEITQVRSLCLSISSISLELLFEFLHVLFKAFHEQYWSFCSTST